MQRQMDEKLQAAQTVLLGAAGHQQLQDFKRAEPLNKFVSEAASWVASASPPFTESQRKQLLRVLAASVQNNTSESANPPAINPRNWRGDLPPLDWPSVFTGAQSFLSPIQLANKKACSLGDPQFEALIREFCAQEGIPVR
jgi:hypothetical protein